MVPSPPILSLCHRCLIRRIFPAQSPLLRRSIAAPLSSSYRPLIRSRYYATTESTASPGAAETDNSTADFQKEAKKSLKQRKKEKLKLDREKFVIIEDEDEVLSKWVITVGLEIHAQLNTKRKLFSDARTSHLSPSNTHIAPFDASLPGSQPIFNPSVLLPALRAVLALHCVPAPESRFDRKHYFYWDQPAGYQITQFYAPLATEGWLILFERDGVTQLKGCHGTEDDGIRIGIQQIQLEQDTGKTIVSPPYSLIDLNRVGSPLIEIITEPFDCPDTVFPSLVMKKIQASLRAVDACVLGMEWGGLRADVNVSVRLRDGPSIYGQRCEIKNVSSIKAVQEAVEAESNRQIEILEAGGTIEGETRGWDAEKGVTRRLRGKEGEVDYRFMPDPDISPVKVSRELMVKVKQSLPPLPDAILSRLTEEPYSLRFKDAQTLMLWDESRASATEKGVVHYYETIVKRVQESLLADQYPADLKKVAGRRPHMKEKMLKEEGRRHVLPEDIGRTVGNWVIHQLGGLLTARNLSWKENPMDVVRMGDLISYVISKRITGPTAKDLLYNLLSTTPIDPRPVPQIIKESGFEVVPVSDDEILALTRKVIFADAQSMGILKELREEKVEITGKKLGTKRKKGLSSWFVGRIMRECQGRVQAERVEAAVWKVVNEKDL